MTRLFPDWNQIHSLKSPLTDGETCLLKYLDKNLPEQWEIYAQPFMNGDRPDIVLLNKDVGMMIIEVKDWNLAQYHFEEELFTENKTKKKIKGKKYFVTDSKGTYPVASPLGQVERYRENLINLYLPQIGDVVDNNNKNLSAFRVGLYFHNATKSEADGFIPGSKRRCTVIGYDSLSENLITDIVPDALRSNSLSMNKDWANDIRFWLKPPYHSMEQGEKIKLSKEQKRHTDPSPGQHQRLRGVAGSGKTLVIAQRAANLASQGKQVLIVTFNITLWHFIRDHISRAQYGFSWGNITFWHFHGFCANFLKENDVEWPHTLPQDTVFDIVVPELVKKTLTDKKNIKNRIYDAILIDEGQDFQESYYHALCEFLSQNDELLLVADEKQNIYQRELDWLGQMSGTKFRGRWRELKESYRLPVPLLKEVNRFAELFLPEIGLSPVPNTYQTTFFDPHLAWRNVESFDLTKDKVLQAFTWLTKKHGIHPQDIVVLVPTHKEGWNLVKLFKEKRININHVFEDEDNPHHHKQSFWMGDGRLKMSTIHSFKGWELLNVIILTPSDEFQNMNNSNVDYLIYIALTRARQSVIVFNRHSKYKEYGKGWPTTW